MGTRTDFPPELQGALTGISDEVINDAGFPYGCHVCEVEVEPELGTLKIIKHTTIDDVGRAVNPLIIHGQTHGGIAQGIGEALIEQVFYDASTGQLISGSFMDYAHATSRHASLFTTELSEVPSISHPHGFRPAGEGGTAPALAVVINAVVDAFVRLWR